MDVKTAFLHGDIDEDVYIKVLEGFEITHEDIAHLNLGDNVDIDSLDPVYAPGTGTPEVGGPNSFQALQVVRELKGVNIVGADMVEVSPPFDASGGTAFLGVSIMYELLCVMAGLVGES